MSLEYITQFKSQENVKYLASIVPGTSAQTLVLFLTTYADFDLLPLWPGVRKLNREFLQRNVKKFAPPTAPVAPALPLQPYSYAEQHLFSEITQLPSEWDKHYNADDIVGDKRLMRREGIPFYQHLSRGPTSVSHFVDEL